MTVKASLCGTLAVVAFGVGGIAHASGIGPVMATATSVGPPPTAVASSAATVVPAPEWTAPSFAGGWSQTQWPTFRGTGKPGLTVQPLSYAKAAYCSATVAADGTWACRTTIPIPDGYWKSWAVASDGQGGQSREVETSFGVGVVHPALVRPANGSVVTTARPLLSGDAANNTNVTVQILAGPGTRRSKVTQVLCTTPHARYAKWACRPAADLAPGTYQVRVKAVDDFGQVEISRTYTFTVVASTTLSTLNGGTGNRDQLPFTGAPIPLMASVAGASLGAGALLVLVARRRRSSDTR